MVNCPLKDELYSGNCEGFTNRTFCMMSEILERLQSLEATIARMKAGEPV